MNPVTIDVRGLKFVPRIILCVKFAWYLFWAHEVTFTGTVVKQ